MGIREKVLWSAFLRRVRKDRPYVIAVGGGIAKTSTKLALGKVLKAKHGNDVRVGYGNLNTFIGVPLAGLGFKIDFHKQKLGILRWVIILKVAYLKGLFTKLPKYLVLEYGTDSPGDIKQLTDMLVPNMALLTTVAQAHVENYGSSMDAVANEESGLIAALGEDGVAILNADDPYLDLHQKNLKTKNVYLVKTNLEDIYKNFAIEASKHLGVNEELSKKVLSEPINAEGRFNIKKLQNLNLIDDTYNANPASMQAALNILKKSEGKKIAILGDMLELGEGEVEAHKKIGQAANNIADTVISVGELAKNYNAQKHFDSSSQAMGNIFPYLEEAGTVLVKGSRGVRMEKIVEEIEKRYGNK